MLHSMSNSFAILWNALLTATIITLLAGLFVAAMPPVYRATSIVQGTSEDMLRLQSADFLAEVLVESSAKTDQLSGWLEQVTSAQLKGIQLLQQKLFVNPGEQPGWINIAVEAQSAETATAFANDIAKIFTRSQERVRLTPEEKAALFKEVTLLDERLAEMVTQSPQVLRYAAEQQRNTQEATRLRQRISQLRDEQNEYRESLQAVRRQQAGSLTEPGVVRALDRLKTYEARIADLASRYGEQHQKMRAALAERDVVTQQLQQALSAFDQRLESQLASKRDQIVRQQTALEQTERAISELDGRYAEYTNLVLARDTALARFERMNEASDSVVYAEAVTPGNTLGFNQILLLMFVFLVSFGLMIVLMVVRGSREANPS